ALCGRLFCGRRFSCPCFGRFGFPRRNSFGFRLRLRLALGPRRSRFRRLRSAGKNFGDADHRKLMPVAAFAARILAPALLEGDHLVAASMLEHLAGNSCARDSRRAELRRVASDHQHHAELDDFSGLTVYWVDRDDVFSGDPILLTAGLDDCEHLSSSCSVPALGLFRAGFFQSLLFVFKGLDSPRKSARTRGPARHAYEGEKHDLSRKPCIQLAPERLTLVSGNGAAQVSLLAGAGSDQVPASPSLPDCTSR